MPVMEVSCARFHSKKNYNMHIYTSYPYFAKFILLHNMFQNVKWMVCYNAYNMPRINMSLIFINFLIN